MADGQTSTHHLEKLEGNNYPTWLYKMVILLKTKGPWSTVEGEPPTEADARRMWEKHEMEAENAIVQSLSSAQTRYVISQTSARGIWKKLEDANRGRVLERTISLKRELGRIQWRKEETAAQYINRLEALSEQLRNLGETLTDAEVAAIAIQGLPKPYYGVARGFDMCAMADITPEKVKYALQEEQRQKKRLY